MEGPKSETTVNWKNPCEAGSLGKQVPKQLPEPPERKGTGQVRQKNELRSFPIKSLAKRGLHFYEHLLKLVLTPFIRKIHHAK